MLKVTLSAYRDICYLSSRTILWIGFAAEKKCFVIRRSRGISNTQIHLFPLSDLGAHECQSSLLLASSRWIISSHFMFVCVCACTRASVILPISVASQYHLSD